MNPHTLAMNIIGRGKKLRRADDRHYRIEVAHKALKLAAGIATEAGKRQVNAERGTRSSRAGQ